MLMLYYVLLYENVRLSHMKSILGKRTHYVQKIEPVRPKLQWERKF